MQSSTLAIAWDNKRSGRMRLWVGFCGLPAARRRPIPFKCVASAKPRAQAARGNRSSAGSGATRAPRTSCPRLARPPVDSPSVPCSSSRSTVTRRAASATVRLSTGSSSSAAAACPARSALSTAASSAATACRSVAASSRGARDLNGSSDSWGSGSVICQIEAPACGASAASTISSTKPQSRASAAHTSSPRCLGVSLAQVSPLAPRRWRQRASRPVRRSTCRRV
jgi:hypothetical protein